ncbi:hypothetical protein ACTFIY_011930 [Dictyostelium cf. discoideum]
MCHERTAPLIYVGRSVSDMYQTLHNHIASEHFLAYPNSVVCYMEFQPTSISRAAIPGPANPRTTSAEAIFLTKYATKINDRYNMGFDTIADRAILAPNGFPYDVLRSFYNFNPNNHLVPFEDVEVFLDQDIDDLDDKQLQSLINIFPEGVPYANGMVLGDGGLDFEEEYNKSCNEMKKQPPKFKTHSVGYMNRVSVSVEALSKLPATIAALSQTIIENTNPTPSIPKLKGKVSPARVAVGTQLPVVTPPSPPKVLVPTKLPAQPKVLSNSSKQLFKIILKQSLKVIRKNGPKIAMRTVRLASGLVRVL